MSSLSTGLPPPSTEGDDDDDDDDDDEGTDLGHLVVELDGARAVEGLQVEDAAPPDAHAVQDDALGGEVNLRRGERQSVRLGQGRLETGSKVR